MKQTRSAFEWNEAQLRSAWELCGEFFLSWWQELPKMNPAGAKAEETPDGMSHEALQAEGLEFSKVLTAVKDRLAGRSEVIGHPGYLAYVAGAANPIAPIAQALAMMMNPYTGTYATAPACVRLEDEALSWIKQMVGWPEDSLGWITTGSSLAILSAVIAAREKRPAPLGQRRVYLADQAHHCIGKALFAAGFQRNEIVLIPTVDGRLAIDQLEKALEQDQAKNLGAIMVFASAGTTNAGRVDPLRDVLHLASKFDTWCHIDAAYGGFFRLLPELHCLDGLEAADSLSLDPHKALCMPYGTGIFLCKHTESSQWPRGANASYMPPLSAEDLRLEYSDISPELSRDFRGLRLWMSLKTFGLQAYRDHLAEKYHLAQDFAARLAKDSRLLLLASPDLSLFPWCIRDDSDGQKTRQLLALIHEDGRFFMTSCDYGGRFAIRTCILGFRTHGSHIDALYQTIERSLKRVL